MARSSIKKIAGLVIVISMVYVAVDGVQAEPPQTVESVEESIEALADPINQEQVDAILAAISGLDDVAEQNRLQDLLHAQVGRRLRGETESPDAAADAALVIPDDELEKRLRALPIGAEATAGQRQERDKLLGLIRSMPDDQRREKFIHLLEEKEMEAGGVVVSPQSSTIPPTESH